MQARHLIHLEKNEDGGHTVTIPALPGCITEGATWDEAIADAQETTTGHLETVRCLPAGQ
jgi:antitoxin HicB